MMNLYIYHSTLIATVYWNVGHCSYWKCANVYHLTYLNWLLIRHVMSEIYHVWMHIFVSFWSKFNNMWNSKSYPWIPWSFPMVIQKVKIVRKLDILLTKGIVNILEQLRRFKEDIDSTTCDLSPAWWKMGMGVHEWIHGLTRVHIVLCLALPLCLIYNLRSQGKWTVLNIGYNNMWIPIIWIRMRYYVSFDGIFNYERWYFPRRVLLISIICTPFGIYVNK